MQFEHPRLYSMLDSRSPALAILAITGIIPGGDHTGMIPRGDHTGTIPGGDHTGTITGRSYWDDTWEIILRWSPGDHTGMILGRSYWDDHREIILGWSREILPVSGSFPSLWAMHESQIALRGFCSSGTPIPFPSWYGCIDFSFFSPSRPFCT